MTSHRIALWGGVECTVNRVGDRWHDQLRRSGHRDRLDDLDRFAALGVRTLRHAILWEHVAPAEPGRCDWRRADASMERLRALDVRPVVGLVHHGSGPRYTSLVDPAFPERLAAYAHAVACRYPWVTDWTPINEPLTTARFAGLYGHWYPHGRDTRTFLRALVLQCTAIARAMRAVRSVIPEARLVQTEDIGTIHATARVAYQAAYENARRWLSLDLLTGRVDAEHPLWRHLLDEGVDEAALGALRDASCPPDVIGVNYYLTSDRVLDERVERYAAVDVGGNGRDRYADVEAVRAWAPGITGHRAILETVWRRYGRRVALTEAHLGGTRDEQLRWLAEAWDAAHAARAGGCDVEAVTVWSLLGAFDWMSLVVRDDGRYESGVFDVRAEPPRATALAGLVAALAAGREWDHPVLDVPGWWHRPDRLLVDAVGPPGGLAASRGRAAARPVLITGAQGCLGHVVARLCTLRGLAHRLVGRTDVDIADAAAVGRALDALRPWAVVNAAGYARIDRAEAERGRCRRDNVAGAAVLAAACAERGVRLLTFSTDLVFDGALRRPYRESDVVGPLGTLGATKVDAEREVRALLPSALIVRSGAFFGPWDARNFVTAALEALAARRPFRAVADAIVSPTYLPDLVHACLDLLIDGEQGLWHVANDGAVTWAELGRAAARAAGHDASLIEECALADLRLPATRPRYSALTSERARLLDGLDRALGCYVRDRAVRAGAAWWPGR